MKEIEINEGKDILHLELIEALGFLTAETLNKECDVGEMVITKIGTNHGNFKYTITCEKINEKIPLKDKIKKWFK